MPTFEEQMAALESVVQRLEHGELPLEESVRLFEEGMRLTAACRQELDAAEGRLQVLTTRPGGGMVPVDVVIEADVRDPEEQDEEE